MASRILTDEQIKQIQKMREDGRSVLEIAEKFYVSKSVVSKYTTIAKPRNFIYPNIEKWVTENGLTMKQAAFECDINLRLFREVVKGIKVPSKTAIDCILKGTGMTYEEAFKEGISMQETTRTAENKQVKAEKIKTPYAKILVNGTADKPYYDILWYDTEKRQWYTGYGSYYIHNVFKWLKEEFEVTGIQFPDTHAHWIEGSEEPDEDGNKWYTCSNCNHGDMHSPSIEVPYCWYCGARMDGVE